VAGKFGRWSSSATKLTSEVAPVERTRGSELPARETSVRQGISSLLTECHPRGLTLIVVQREAEMLQRALSLFHSELTASRPTICRACSPSFDFLSSVPGGVMIVLYTAASGMQAQQFIWTPLPTTWPTPAPPLSAAPGFSPGLPVPDMVMPGTAADQQTRSRRASRLALALVPALPDHPAAKAISTPGNPSISPRRPGFFSHLPARNRLTVRSLSSGRARHVRNADGTPLEPSITISQEATSHHCFRRNRVSHARRSASGATCGKHPARIFSQPGRRTASARLFSLPTVRRSVSAPLAERRPGTDGQDIWSVNVSVFE